LQRVANIADDVLICDINSWLRGKQAWRRSKRHDNEHAE
jgi:hypothetical protein